MYKLAFFVPETHLDFVKQAAFDAGAGRAGPTSRYDQCCWQTAGIGQFRPLDGSDPFIGEMNQIEQLVEYRVEMICEDSLIHAAVQALRSVHPYEEPAIDVWPLTDISQ